MDWDKGFRSKASHKLLQIGNVCMARAVVVNQLDCMTFDKLKGPLAGDLLEVTRPEGPTQRRTCQSASPLQIADHGIAKEQHEVLRRLSELLGKDPAASNRCKPLESSCLLDEHPLAMGKPDPEPRPASLRNQGVVRRRGHGRRIEIEDQLPAGAAGL